MTAAVISIVLGKLEETGTIGSRLAGHVRDRRAPRRCCIPSSSCGSRSPSVEGRARPSDEVGGDAQDDKLGSLGELFGDPRWRRNTIVGMLLAFAGVVGLWGIGFFSFDLIRIVFRKPFRAPRA